MIHYIKKRLISDSQHILELAKNEAEIGHPVIKGRFREILVNNLGASGFCVGKQQIC